MKASKKSAPRRSGKEAIEQALKRLTDDIGSLERKWAKLPEDVRVRYPDLARFFGKPPKA